MIELKPEEVVMYHGSLDEFNGLLEAEGSSRHAVVASRFEYVSKATTPTPSDELQTIPIRREILGEGFHGIVNRRTVYAGKRSVPNNHIIGSTSEFDIYRVEGTPIVFSEETD